MADHSPPTANIAHPPSYYRARIDYIEHLLDEYRQELKENSSDSRREIVEKNIVLLRNGVFPPNNAHQAVVYQIPQLLLEKNYPNTPLSFNEITRYSTWFEMHPEKVAGEEIISSSREFPLTIKGSKEDIERILKAGIAGKNIKLQTIHMMTLKAKALKLKLDLLKGDDKLEGFNSYALNGLDGAAFLDGLGELGEADLQTVNANSLTVQSILKRSEEEAGQKNKQTLSFEEVDTLYNKGISEEEKKAWVWYKRSLGFPMKGWDKYYIHSKAGKNEEILRTTEDTVIKDNRWENVTSMKKGNIIGKPTKFSNEYDGINYLVFIGTDGHKYLVNEKHVTRQSTGMITDEKVLNEWVEKEILFYSKGDYLPYPYFAYGNMYDRGLQLKEDKEAIVEKFGEATYRKHEELINSLKPKLITVTNPDPNERPKILAISEFAKNFFVLELRDETGIEFPVNSENEEGFPVARYSLTDAFTEWLRSLDNHHFREVSAYEIIQYYLNGKNLGKKLSDEEKSTIDKYGRIEGEELFSKFLYEAVTFEDQQKIDFSWNRVYNGYSSIPYHRVPIGFQCSYKFKQFSLQFTPAQREAIAFMEIAGSGIIAYDVGVGKTMSAIITAANAMYSGKCKRPIIVVPNPTYQKWIREIVGFTDPRSGESIPGVLSHTGVKVNDWYNLGTGIIKSLNFEKAVEENTITMLTYEGLNKIGFSSKVMGLMFQELSEILAQARDEEKSARDLEKKYQTFRELIGVGLKNTIADIDTLGFDYIVIDEGHNFKNVFADVPTDEDGVKRFKIQGAQSSRAVKAFFLCNYIQRTFGSNVMLLTATPFTNSPLEIYSMLSLVGHESMRKMGIVSVERFMETFVLQSLEYVNSYDDTIREAVVVKSFNNRLILQRLIHNHIAYKTGEEAGVKRPCKINLPRINATQADGSIKRLPNDKQIVTYLQMSGPQRDNQQAIIEAARSGSAKDGSIMRAMGQSLDNALSPFLYKFNRPPEDYKDFVEESPKILYVMECIRSVKAYHENKKEEVSGQIIYANRGKEYFPLIKEYLEKEIGYKTRIKHNSKAFDEVEIISSGIPGDKKEAIKDAFLDGVVKIIIGTATIREGIDLQKKGTVLYNCYPDWNPTDVKQLEGRIWRQGNEFGYVRSVMPLVQDSMDVFVFQKLEEKTARINDIWYRGDRGNVIDLESLDPEEVKFALFTNTQALAQMTIDKERKDIRRRLSVAESNVEVLARFNWKLKQYYDYQAKCREQINLFTRTFKESFSNKENPIFQQWWWTNKTEKEQKSLLERINKHIKEAEAFIESAEKEDKELLRLGRMFFKVGLEVGQRGNEYNFNEFKMYLSEVRKAERSVLASKGYSLEDDVDQIIEEFKKEVAVINAEMEETKSPEYIAAKMDEVVKKKEKLAIKGATVEERAAEFSKLNYLLDYRAKEVDGDNCMLPNEGEKIVSKVDPVKLLKLKAKALKLKLELLKSAA
jgi:hypothetical protein